jgi:hypothetical protein
MRIVISVVGILIASLLFATGLIETNAPQATVGLVLLPIAAIYGLAGGRRPDESADAGHALHH